MNEEERGSNTRTDEKKGDEDREREMNNGERGGGGEIRRRAGKGTSRFKGCRLPRGETSGC